MYNLDLKTRKCNITVPHRGWIPRGPHPGDKFMSINIIGASGYPKERITVLQFVSNKTQGDLMKLLFFLNHNNVSMHDIFRLS